MLLLQRENENKIVISLNQLTTITNPNYLFSFFHQQKRKYFNIYLTPVSSSDRYDLFSITLPTDLDLVKGNYIFSVYESDDLETSTDGKTLLIKGKAEVITTFPEDSFYTINTINKINYVQ